MPRAGSCAHPKFCLEYPELLIALAMAVLRSLYSTCSLLTSCSHNQSANTQAVTPVNKFGLLTAIDFDCDRYQFDQKDESNFKLIAGTI